MLFFSGVIKRSLKIISVENFILFDIITKRHLFMFRNHILINTKKACMYLF